MLSTSNKTKFQYQYLLIAVVIILALVSVIALYQSGALPPISTGQAPASTGDEMDSATRSYIAQGMAMIAKRQAGLDLSQPPRPDFSHLTEKAIIPNTGSVEDLTSYHSSEWGASAAVQNSSDIYHPSSIQYNSPGR
jgi:hypothetical protein